MNILSLFDGMSCAQIALKRLGVPIRKYYASEIDKFAIQQTQHNFPDTIQLGDVERWREWNIDWSSIDILFAGSPCQGFSFAGKQLAFDDPRSCLFFVFIDILNHIRSVNPNVKFLLENVKMKKQHRSVITQYCGLKPVRINSNLVSAQNRDRLYWSNIRTNKEGFFGTPYIDIPQPEDRGLLLRDILEDEVDEKYYVSKAVLNRLLNANKNFNPKVNPEKAGTLTQGNNSSKMSFDSGTTFISINGKAPTQRSSTGRSLDKKHNYQFIVLDTDGDVKKKQDKSSCLVAGGHGAGNHSDMDLIATFDKKPIIQLNPSKQSGGVQPYQQDRIYDENGICPALLADMSSGTHAIYQRPRGNNTGGLFEDKAPTLSVNAWEQNNLLCISSNQKNATISINKSTPMVSAMGMGGGHVPMVTAGRIRRLTPLECSRLQTIPSWYEWIVSDTQIYKMLGNGWTVEVIAHILSFWKEVRERQTA